MHWWEVKNEGTCRIELVAAMLMYNIVLTTTSLYHAMHQWKLQEIMATGVHNL